MKELVRAANPRNCDCQQSESSAQNAIRAAEGPPAAPALWVMVKRGSKLAVEVLREIFDESAYARFLDRHQLAPSHSTYDAFRQEHEHDRACRPRCC